MDLLDFPVPARSADDDVAGEALIREFYDAFNDRRLRDAADLVAEDAVLEGLPFDQAQRGPDGYLRFADAWLCAFPDGRLRIERIEWRGEAISQVSLIGTGTHLGTFGAPAMGRFKATRAAVTLRFREVLEIRGGKIALASRSFDTHELLRQLVPVNLDELRMRLQRVRRLAGELAQAAADPAWQHAVLERLGLELDAARREVRPHLNRPPATL